MSDRVVRCPYGPVAVEVPDEIFARTLWRSLEANRSSRALVEVGTGQTITYGQLLTRAELVARRLVGQFGCRPLDVVVIFSPNSITWLVVFAAICRIGAVPAAVNSLLTRKELVHQLKISEAKAVFTTSALTSLAVDVANSLDIKTVLVSGRDCPGCVNIESPHRPDLEHLPELPSFDSLSLGPGDPALIFFSSGTTGVQKGVLLSQGNIQHEFAEGRLPYLNLLGNESLVFAPLSHVTGCLMAMYSLALGTVIHIMPKFDFEEFLRTIEHNKIDRIGLVPPIATMMVKSAISLKYKLSSLKDIIFAAAPLKAELEEQLVERYPGVTIRQVYGLTETTGGVVGTPQREERCYRHKPGSCGVPFPSVAVKVIDLNTGEALGPHAEGEVLIKAPQIMLRYVNNPKATANTIDADGWLHSGDIGYYDEDGYLFIVDRLKELIKYNAYQVPPAELEDVLLSHPEVDDAGVIGVPDADAGELPHAWVVRKPNSSVTETELQQYVDGRVAPFKRLRGGVRFVASIPKTASGKILRREMKDALRSAKL